MKGIDIVFNFAAVADIDILQKFHLKLRNKYFRID